MPRSLRRGDPPRRKELRSGKRAERLDLEWSLPLELRLRAHSCRQRSASLKVATCPFYRGYFTLARPRRWRGAGGLSEGRGARRGVRAAIPSGPIPTSRGLERPGPVCPHRPFAGWTLAPPKSRTTSNAETVALRAQTRACSGERSVATRPLLAGNPRARPGLNLRERETWTWAPCTNG